MSAVAMGDTGVAIVAVGVLVSSSLPECSAMAMTVTGQGIDFTRLATGGLGVTLPGDKLGSAMEGGDRDSSRSGGSSSAMLSSIGAGGASCAMPGPRGRTRFIKSNDHPCTGKVGGCSASVEGIRSSATQWVMKSETSIDLTKVLGEEGTTGLVTSAVEMAAM